MPHICRMAALLAVMIGVALTVAFVWKPAPPTPFAGLAGRDIPQAVGGCIAGADDLVPPEVQAALASATLTSRTYRPANETGAGGDSFNFLLIGGTDRSALHDPRSCLIGAGMQVQDDHLERLPGTDIEARACRSVGGASGDKNAGFDIIYLYLVNGRVVNQATQIRAAMLWSAVLGQRGTPVYFLRFTRPLFSDPRRDAAGHAAMLHFATEMWTALQPRLRPALRPIKGYALVYQNQCRRRRLS